LPTIQIINHAVELFYLACLIELAAFDPKDERGLVVEPIRWVAGHESTEFVAEIL
jgi:hypothetical protein